jgi:hypothetical protein
LDPSIGRANGRTGKWTAVEDSKLKVAVKTHGGNDWVGIALLVTGRSKKQCWSRWYDILDPNIDSNARTRKWTVDEDSKLKAGVQRHGDKDWIAIAALVPGRTRPQCLKRWHESLDLVDVRTGKWTAAENMQLKIAVQTDGGKNWGAIAALVPGRTKKQCYGRWQDTLNLNIDETNGDTGKWTALEDMQLKIAVQTYGGKNWPALAALVPSRTQKQSYTRWHDNLDLNIDQTNGVTSKWTALEDMRLKVAVQTYGGENWGTIATLVPSRTQMQYWSRWQHALADPTIDLTHGHNSPWLPDRR